MAPADDEPRGPRDIPWRDVRPDGEVALSVEGVTVRFGGLTALDDVSLDVAPGEVVGVIGPNGAGKTTLFNVICGFVRPAGGTVSWRGASLNRVRPHDLAGLGIARTLQGVGLFAGLTAVENVMVGAERAARAGVLSALLGLPRSDRDERRLRALALDAARQVPADALGAALARLGHWIVEARAHAALAAQLGDARAHRPGAEHSDQRRGSGHGPEPTASAVVPRSQQERTNFGARRR